MEAEADKLAFARSLDARLAHAWRAVAASPSSFQGAADTGFGLDGLPVLPDAYDAAVLRACAPSTVLLLAAVAMAGEAPSPVVRDAALRALLDVRHTPPWIRAAFLAFHLQGAPAVGEGVAGLLGRLLGHSFADAARADAADLPLRALAEACRDAPSAERASPRLLSALRGDAPGLFAISLALENLPVDAVLLHAVFSHRADNVFRALLAPSPASRRDRLELLVPAVLARYAHRDESTALHFLDLFAEVAGPFALSRADALLLHALPWLAMDVPLRDLRTAPTLPFRSRLAQRGCHLRLPGPFSLTAEALAEAAPLVAETLSPPSAGFRLENRHRLSRFLPLAASNSNAAATLHRLVLRLQAACARAPRHWCGRSLSPDDLHPADAAWVCGAPVASLAREAARPREDQAGWLRGIALPGPLFLPEALDAMDSATIDALARAFPDDLEASGALAAARADASRPRRLRAYAWAEWVFRHDPDEIQAKAAALPADSGARPSGLPPVAVNRAVPRARFGREWSSVITTEAIRRDDVALFDRFLMGMPDESLLWQILDAGAAQTLAHVIHAYPRLTPGLPPGRLLLELCERGDAGFAAPLLEALETAHPGILAGTTDEEGFDAAWHVLFGLDGGRPGALPWEELEPGRERGELLRLLLAHGCPADRPTRFGVTLADILDVATDIAIRGYS